MLCKNAREGNVKDTHEIMALISLIALTWWSHMEGYKKGKLYTWGTTRMLSFSGVVELTTQLLILENILWLPLSRTNKFGLNTLPSKTVAIPYPVGYQDLFRAPLPGSIALFSEPVGIYIYLSQ